MTVAEQLGAVMQAVGFVLIVFAVVWIALILWYRR